MIKNSFAYLFLLVLTVTACSSIDVFNQNAFDQAINLKVESLALLDKSSEPYEEHIDEINSIKLKAQIAYEYSKFRPKNEDSSTQWAIMINPEKNLLFGAFELWKEKKQLSPTFVSNLKGIISEAYDEIIKLEIGKR